jgi:hypothetical protein
MNMALNTNMTTMADGAAPADLVAPPVELPAFEVPGKTEMFDLMDELPGPHLKMSLWTALDAILGHTLRRYGFRTAVKNQVNELVPMIARRIGEGRAGYLLRLNVYADEHGNLYFPGGEVVSALGVGLEPVDALAETYRAGVIRNSRPSGLRDESSYCWMIKVGGTLRCTSIPPSIARELESQARTEATRREISGGFARTAATGIDRAAVAQHWVDVYRARVLQLGSEQVARQLMGYQRRLEAEEEAFNRAYEGFQRTVQEMAAEAREQQFLSAVSTVIGALGTAIKLKDAMSTPTQTSAAPMSREQLEIWHAEKMKVLGDNQKALHEQANALADSLRTMQAKIDAIYRTRGIPVPAHPTIPRIQHE